MKPFLIRGPQNQTAVVGSSVTFQCRVGGEPGEFLIRTFTLIVRSSVFYIQRYTFFAIPVPDVLWRRSASGGNMPLREYIAYTYFGWVYPKTHLYFVQHTNNESYSFNFDVLRSYGIFASQNGMNNRP